MSEPVSVFLSIFFMFVTSAPLCGLLIDFRGAPSVALRQSQNEVPDDIPLNLGGPGLDGVSSRSKIPVRPLPVVNRVFALTGKLAVWTK